MRTGKRAKTVTVEIDETRLNDAFIEVHNMKINIEYLIPNSKIPNTEIRNQSLIVPFLPFSFFFYF